MRELSLDEVNCVSGGYFDLHKANFGNPSLAIRGAYYGVRAIPVVRAGMTGVAIGNAINKYTPVQRWIANGLDRVTGLR